MSAMKLKRSNDRKVANAVSKNGKTPTIANTFGLPAGKAFSCPGATSICESVCYAGKLEKVYKGVRAVPGRAIGGVLHQALQIIRVLPHIEAMRVERRGNRGDLRQGGVAACAIGLVEQIGRHHDGQHAQNGHDDEHDESVLN